MPGSILMLVLALANVAPAAAAGPPVILMNPTTNDGSLESNAVCTFPAFYLCAKR